MNPDYYSGPIYDFRAQERAAKRRAELHRKAKQRRKKAKRGGKK